MNGLSRRELLTFFLGAPIAAACSRWRKPPDIRFEGAIVGANERLGHKLRDGFRPKPERELRTRVAIVGGGVAGLSAAWRLKRAGMEDFIVFELDEVAGGTARGGENAVCKYPWGAHYVPRPLAHARAVNELLVEAGVAQKGSDGALVFDETQLCRTPQERLFIADRWYEGLYPQAGATTADQQELARFQEEVEQLSQRTDSAGRRAFAVPMAYGATAESGDSDIVALDRISMAEWLTQHNYKSDRLKWYIEYACRDDFGALLTGTSAWAGLHYFASRRDHGEAAEMLTWPEGNARLVGHMEKSLRKQLRCQTAVTSIVPRKPGAEVIAYAPAKNSCERIIADHVIVAVPRPFAARLLSHPQIAEGAHEFQSGAWLVANLTLRRRPKSRGFPESWDNVIYGSKGLGYVVATHQADKHGGGPQATVWTYYLPLSEDDPNVGRRWLYAIDWREAADIVLADLRRPHPDIADCIERLDVWRWGHAMIRPRPGFIFGKHRIGAQAPLGDIHFAHAELSGLALFEEAQYHGVRAAEEILGRRGGLGESLL